MKIDIQIRQITHNDIDSLSQFFVANNRPEIIRHFHPFPLNQQTAQTLASLSDGDQYFIALHQDQIIGFCMLRGWSEGYDIPSFGVLVDQSHQGKGLGRRLTEFAIQAAQDLGCSSLRLSVNESNIPAVKLYRSLQFEEMSREEIRFGDEIDTKIVMMKTLTK